MPIVKTDRAQNLLAAALIGVLTLVCASNARAQSEESEAPPALGEFEAAPLPPPEQPFLVPDVPQSVVEKTQIKVRWIMLKVGVVALADYTAFNQDTDSVEQVTSRRTSGMPARRD